MDFREILRWIFGIAAVASAIAILVTALNIDSNNRNVDEGLTYINGYKKSIEEDNSVLKEQQVFFAMLSTCKTSTDSSLSKFESIIPIYMETASAKIVNLEANIQSSKNGIHEYKNVIKKESIDADSRRGVRWIFVLILIGNVSSFVLFGCIPWDDWWYDFKIKMIRNPSKVYVITKINNQGNVVYVVLVARWWFKEENKKFSTQEEAHQYAFVLKRENLVSHWHEVKG